MLRAVSRPRPAGLLSMVLIARHQSHLNNLFMSPFCYESKLHSRASNLLLTSPAEACWPTQLRTGAWRERGLQCRHSRSPLTCRPLGPPLSLPLRAFSRG